MFSIIVVTISIALIALITYGTMSYIGDGFIEGVEETKVVRYINEAQQISGAIRLYQADNGGQLPSDITTDLKGYYLKDIPKSGENWEITDGAIKKLIGDLNECEAVNKKSNWINPNYVEGSDAVGKFEPLSCSEIDESGVQYFCCTNAST